MIEIWPLSENDSQPRVNKLHLCTKKQQKTWKQKQTENIVRVFECDSQLGNSDDFLGWDETSCHTGHKLFSICIEQFFLFLL